jgi:hypothetical protein
MCYSVIKIYQYKVCYISLSFGMFNYIGKFFNFNVVSIYFKFLMCKTLVVKLICFPFNFLAVEVHPVSVVVKALCCKPEGCRFKS